MKPEQTQGGGFAGGVFSGPGAAPPRSSLFELAEALDATGRSVVGGLVDNYGKRIEESKKAALSEAEVFEQATAGYTAEMLQAEIDSEPMAAKFKANPYLLPAINVYRGRKLADELGLRMINEGVDTGDAEAVQAWYQQNAPDLSDPFYARGFNEQNQRLQAQFNQQQMKDALTAASQDRLAGAGEIWQQTFLETGDVSAATAALKDSAFGSSVDGAELSALQFEVAQQLAQEGNIELLSALVDTPRGDAPALASSVGYRGDVAMLKERAQSKRVQDEQGARNYAQAQLLTLVNDGATEAEIRRSPFFSQLARPGQGDKELSQEQFEVVRTYETRREAIKREVARERSMIALEEQAKRAEERAAALLAAGQGYAITGMTVTDEETGKSRRISASDLRAAAVGATRSMMLGENPFTLQGEAAAAYRTYTALLSASGQHDPQLKAALGGMASALTADGIVDNPASVTQAYEIYRNLNAHGRQVYVSDARSRALLESIDRRIQENPRLDVISAAKQAIAVSESRVRIEASSAAIGAAAASIRLVDPVNDRPWYQGGGQRKFTPDRRQVQDFLAERSSEFMAYGMTPAEAAAAAARDAESMFTVVNGVAVRLPERPVGTGQSSGIPTPEVWGREVNTFLHAYGARAKIPAGELRLSWSTGNQYALTRVPSDDGEPEFLDNVFVGDILGVNYVTAKEAAATASKILPTSPSSAPSTSARIDAKRARQKDADANMALALGGGLYNPDN